MKGELHLYALEDGSRRYVGIRYIGDDVERLLALDGMPQARSCRVQNLRGLMGNLSQGIVASLVATTLWACVVLYAPYLPALVDLLVRFAEQVSVDLGAMAYEASTLRQAVSAKPGTANPESAHIDGVRECFGPKPHVLDETRPPSPPRTAGAARG